MAYLDATRLLDYQASMATSDVRFQPHGLINIAKDSGNSIDYIDPQTRRLMETMSSARGQKIPILKDTEATVSTVPSFDIPANLGETDTYGYTAFDVFSGFRLYPASLLNDQMSEESVQNAIRFYFNNNMKRVEEAMALKIEETILSVIDSRKSQVVDFTTQVSQGDGTYTFNDTDNILEIQKAAQKETMFYNLEQLMNNNQLPGQVRLVTSKGGLIVQRSEAAKYGSNNEKNLQALGFLDSSRLYETSEIAPDTDIFNGYLIRDGDIGLIPNHPYDFQKGTEFAGKQWSVSPIDMPMLGMPINVFVNKEPTDAESLFTDSDSNMKMTHYEEIAFWARFYVPYRYNTDLATRSNGIFKLKGLTS